MFSAAEGVGVAAEPKAVEVNTSWVVDAGRRTNYDAVSLSLSGPGWSRMDKAEFPHWKCAGGKQEGGRIARRVAECQACCRSLWFVGKKK